MRRKIWIALLAFGAVGGFAVGFARLHHYHHHGYGPGWGRGPWGHERRAAFERHVAEVCTQAAGKVFESKNKPGASP